MMCMADSEIRLSLSELSWLSWSGRQSVRQTATNNSIKSLMIIINLASPYVHMHTEINGLDSSTSHPVGDFTSRSRNSMVILIT